MGCESYSGLLQQIDEFKMKVVYNAKELGLDANKKIYECCVCNKLFNWDDNSSWFGTLKQWDETPHKLKFFCCDPCSDKYKSLNKSR